MATEQRPTTERLGDPGELATPAAALTTEDVWRALDSATFAVLSHVTPSGEPRSSGVLYTVVDRRLYVAVARDGWKARHIPVTGLVAVTVPVRRGGLLALVLPIPPATVSFHATARVTPADVLTSGPLRERLAPLLPPERLTSSSLVEIRPEGAFVTYGLGVSLRDMRHPDRARARVRVG
jgi:hypothetical protein